MNNNKFYSMMGDAVDTIHSWEESTDKFNCMIDGCQTSCDIEQCRSIKEQIKTQIINMFNQFIDKHNIINVLSASSLEDFMKEKSDSFISKMDEKYVSSFLEKKNFEDSYYEKVIKNQENG